MSIRTKLTVALAVTTTVLLLQGCGGSGGGGLNNNGSSGSGGTTSSSSGSSSGSPVKGPLSLSFDPATLLENGGTATGTVTRTQTNAGLAIVSLTASPAANPTRVSITPSSLSLADGVSSATFTVTGIDNSLIEGNVTVIVSAASTGYVSASSTLDLIDDDSTAALSFSFSKTTVSENRGMLSGKVMRNKRETTPLTVNLTSSDTGEATVPATVVIPANAYDASLTITGVDDTESDGDQPVTITATATDYTTGTLAISVADNESALSISVPSTTVTERDGTVVATLHRSGSTSNDLVVTLKSSDTSEVVVPASATILAGSNDVTFDMTIMDDEIIDASQIALITASAGLMSAQLTMTVSDDDPCLKIIPDNNPISEKNGAGTAILRRTGGLTSAKLTVALSLDDTSELNISDSSLVLDIGIKEKTFSYSGVDDLIPDGPQQATISASATGITGGSVKITVTDDEPRLALTLTPNSATETAGAGTVTARIERLGATTTADLVLTLSSTDTSEATVPATVTIPAGQGSATFPVTVINDDLADGDQAVVIRAVAPGFDYAAATLTVQDDDLGYSLTIQTPIICENGGASQAVLSRPQPWTSALTVTLASSDTTEATVPATITIAAGSGSATFSIAAVNDADLESVPVETVVISANFGSTTVSATLDVADDDLHKSFSIQGTLTDDSTAKAGAKLDLFYKNRPCNSSVTTDAAGAYVFGPLWGELTNYTYTVK